MGGKKSLFQGKKKDGWAMLTIAFDGSIPKLFINANEITATASNYAGTYTKMGNYTTRLRAYGYVGLFDEVSFHKNRVLTISEIETIYNGAAGNLYANWNAALKTNLECYYDATGNDLHANNPIDSFYQAGISIGKFGNTYICNVSISDLKFNYGLFNPASATVDLPFTYNMWYKPTATSGGFIYSGMGTYGINYNVWRLEPRHDGCVLTFYSNNSATDYKQYTYNFSSVL